MHASVRHSRHACFMHASLRYFFLFLLFPQMKQFYQQAAFYAII